jgi:hypothetical protein
MDYTYKFYYQCLPDDLKQEIINMWLEAGVLDLQRATDRINDVVLVGFDPDNKVCCVTTVYLEQLQDGYYYYFRMFIKEEDRGKLKSFKSSKLTHEYLRTYTHPLNPKGIIAVAENPKITPRIMKMEGWNYHGKNNLNQDVYYVLF